MLYPSFLHPIKFCQQLSSPSACFLNNVVSTKWTKYISVGSLKSKIRSSFLFTKQAATTRRAPPWYPWPHRLVISIMTTLVRWRWLETSIWGPQLQIHKIHKNSPQGKWYTEYMYCKLFCNHLNHNNFPFICIKITIWFKI